MYITISFYSGSRRMLGENLPLFKTHLMLCLCLWRPTVSCARQNMHRACTTEGCTADCTTNCTLTPHTQRFVINTLCRIAIIMIASDQNPHSDHKDDFAVVAPRVLFLLSGTFPRFEAFAHTMVPPNRNLLSSLLSI